MNEHLSKRGVKVKDYGISEGRAWVQIKCNGKVKTVYSEPLGSRDYVLDNLNKFRTDLLRNCGKYTTKIGDLIVLVRKLIEPSGVYYIAFLPETPCPTGYITGFTETGHCEISLEVFKATKYVDESDEVGVKALKDKLENVVYTDYNIKYRKILKHEVISKSWDKYNKDWIRFQVKKVRE